MFSYLLALRAKIIPCINDGMPVLKPDSKVSLVADAENELESTWKINISAG